MEREAGARAPAGGAEFSLHLPTPNPLDQETVITPSEVHAWVVAHRAKFTKLTFHFEAGPFVDTRAGVVAGPWWADAAVDGKRAPVVGMDTIKFENGLVTEYWTVGKPADGPGRWIRSLR